MFLRVTRSVIRLAIAAIPVCGLLASANAASTYMTNQLSYTGENIPNPAYGKQIKSIMIFQPAGWTGFGGPDYIGTYQFPMPFNGGLNAYLNRSQSMYETQMAKIRDLSANTAVAVLIQPDTEASAVGFITCWGGAVSTVNAGSCTSGTRMTPTQLLPYVKNAAWKKGVMVAPFFSINAYDSIPGSYTRAQWSFEKLKQLTEWWLANTDGTTLRTQATATEPSRVVILTEGFLSEIDKDPTVQQAALSYMASKLNSVLWIDNIVNIDTNPAAAPDNVIRSAAAANPAVQDWVASQWGSRYRYHHLNRIATCNLKNPIPDQFGHPIVSPSGQQIICDRRIDPVTYIEKDKDGKTVTDANGNPVQKQYYQVTYFDETQRQKTLNISPNNPNGYPVVISQFNEYSEWLDYEDDSYGGASEYNYLQWRLSQQP